jgi:predicted DNA-binding transcriptional regulator AlpA
MTPRALGLLRDSADVGAPSADALEPLLTAVEVARILGERPKRVYELGIPAVRISEKALRWRRSAVQGWLDARTEGGPR